ncbi:MAG: hypothetical protein M1834_001382 [Cirrosporium novae-zelandiae]|nr:MAG: hypothetical protein M1834_001382 [Cirrosporium novae-zelandiae]
MPVSHVGLTVSHLPTSCSFFLAALQPLGFRYIGQQGNQIGFGVDHPEFFICQETPGTKAGAAHIAFPARSKAAVNNFFTSALKAGGQIHGEPAIRDPSSGYYSAAVMDFDGNSIEAAYNPSADDNDSKVGARSVYNAPEETRSISGSRSIATSVPQTVMSNAQSDRNQDKGVKTLIGTLLGAAAGAAVAYAMTRDEENEQGKPMAHEASQSSTQNSFVPAMNQFVPTMGQFIQGVTMIRDQTPTNSHAMSHVEEPLPLRAIEAPPPHPCSPSTIVDSFIAPSEIRSDARSEYRPRYARAETDVDSVYLHPESAVGNNSVVSLHSTRSYRSSHSRCAPSACSSRRSRSRSRSRARTNRSVSQAPSRHGTVVSVRSSHHPSSIRSSSRSTAHSHRSRRMSPSRSTTSSHRSQSQSSSSVASSDQGSEASSATIKQSHHKRSSSPSASQVSLPKSHASSRYTKASSRVSSKAPGRVSTTRSVSAANLPLPPSKAGSSVSAATHATHKTSKTAASYMSIKEDVVPESIGGDDCYIDDMASIAPSDSVSQIGSKHSRNHRERSEVGSRAGSYAGSRVSSHASTIKDERRSIISLPLRGSSKVGNSKRSVVTALMGKV